MKRSLVLQGIPDALPDVVLQVFQPGNTQAIIKDSIKQLGVVHIQVVGQPRLPIEPRTEFLDAASEAEYLLAVVLVREHHRIVLGVVIESLVDETRQVNVVPHIQSAGERSSRSSGVDASEHCFRVLGLRLEDDLHKNK